MNTTKSTALACLLTFALGTGAGWWAGRELFPRRVDRQQRYQQMLERFGTQLNLTPEQKEQVKVLFEAKRQKMKALREETRPRYDEIRRAAKEDIRKLLTPEQQKKFDQMELEWEARRLKRSARWSSG